MEIETRKIYSGYPISVGYQTNGDGEAINTKVLSLMIGRMIMERVTKARRLIQFRTNLISKVA